eukprot:TRINITY_DN18664_c0_g1_i1.p1 TRINITY_DN18664_c0_g1~~TRINITY_DN18664_c0_g1_i1.p1  ORF type:complete len:923 (+),score=113.30 TRINITY_DN18664_c0_g1_i1:43-2811(+)
MIETVAVDQITCDTARASILFNNEGGFTGHVCWVLLQGRGDIPSMLQEGKAIRDLVTGRRPERYLRFRSSVCDSGCEPSNKRTVIEIRFSNLVNNQHHQIIVAALAPDSISSVRSQYTQFKTLALPLTCVSAPKFLLFEQISGTSSRSDFSFSSTGQGKLRYTVLDGCCYDLAKVTNTFVEEDEVEEDLNDDEIAIRTLITTGGTLTVTSDGDHMFSIISKNIVADTTYTLVVQSDRHSPKMIVEFDTSPNTCLVNYNYQPGSSTVDVVVSEPGLVWYAIVRAATAMPWSIRGKELIELVRRNPTAGVNTFEKGGDLLATERVVVGSDKKIVLAIDGLPDSEHHVLLILPTTRTGRWVDSPTRVLLSPSTDFYESEGQMTINQPVVTKTLLLDHFTLTFNLSKWAALGANCIVSFALLPITSSSTTITLSQLLNASDSHPGAVSVQLQTKGPGPHRTSFSTAVGISYMLYGAVHLSSCNLNSSLSSVSKEPITALLKVSTDETRDLLMRRKRERVPATKGAFVDSWREGRPRLRKIKTENPSKVVKIGRAQAKGIYEKCHRGPWNTKTSGIVSPLIVEAGDVAARVKNARINSTEHALELKKIFCSFNLTDRLNTSFIIQCKHCNRVEGSSTIKVLEIKRTHRGLTRFHSAYKRGLVVTNSYRVLYKLPPLKPIPLSTVNRWLDLLGAGESNITSTPWDVSWPIFLILCTFQEADRPILSDLKSRFLRTTSQDTFHTREQYTELLTTLAVEMGMTDRDAAFSSSGFSDADFYRGFEFNFAEVVISLFFSRFDQLSLLRSRGRGTALDRNFQNHHMCLSGSYQPTSPTTISPDMISVDESDVFPDSIELQPSFTADDVISDTNDGSSPNPTVAFDRNIRGSLTKSTLRNMNHVLAPEHRRKSSSFIPVGKEMPLGVHRNSKPA